jgi:hypothetical protein
MSPSTALRRFSYILLLGVSFALMESRLLADDMSFVAGFCAHWDSNHDCNCNISTTSNWQAEGACDFSEEPQPEFLGDEFCYGALDACTRDCESDEFVEWLQEQECPDFDPCNPECYTEFWIGFTSGYGCSAGAASEFNCTCGGFNWGEIGC